MSISEADKWQETWDKMEEAERRDIGEISEDDAEEFRRQDREDKGITHLEERRRREPAIGEPCERCGGSGRLQVSGAIDDFSFYECPCRHGTKEEP